MYRLLTEGCLGNAYAGSGESGKSTILKQMKIINQNGYTKQELFSWRIIVYRNIVESAQALSQAILDLSLEFEFPENTVWKRQTKKNDKLSVSQLRRVICRKTPSGSSTTRSLVILNSSWAPILLKLLLRYGQTEPRPNVSRKGATSFI